MSVRRGVPLVAIAMVACASASWDGRVDTWGSMHAVMHDGDTQGRVRLSDAIADPHAFGIGALTGLSGEIAIVDGTAWTSRVDAAGRIETSKALHFGDEATLLAVAHVAHWSTGPIEHDLALGELGEYVRRRADQLGLQRTLTFPFLITGDLDELDAHVLNGRCPYAGPGAGPDAAATAPVEDARARAHGTLVGFYTDGEAGKLTHRGERTHVHVVLEGVDPFVGHVDAARVLSGASLALPAP
jgi:hypothetical protein